MFQYFATHYEFIKVKDHKSYLIMHFTDLYKLSEQTQTPFVEGLDQKRNCKDTVYKIEII